jgi:hypothetical protein
MSRRSFWGVILPAKAHLTSRLDESFARREGLEPRHHQAFIDGIS